MVDLITSLRGSDVISYHNVGYIAVAVPTLMHSKVRCSRTDVHCEFPLMRSKVRCIRTDIHCEFPRAVMTLFLRTLSLLAATTLAGKVTLNLNNYKKCK